MRSIEVHGPMTRAKLGQEIAQMFARYVEVGTFFSVLTDASLIYFLLSLENTIRGFEILQLGHGPSRYQNREPRSYIRVELFRWKLAG